MKAVKPKPHHSIVAALALCTFLGVSAQAQIDFVQITDPHIFDGGKEASENRSVLAASVKKINERKAEGNDYRFVVVTGDLGIESLVSTYDEKKEESILKTDQAEIQREIERGAAELAAILSLSRVSTWLFVPGNNDLINESLDSIKYYHDFIIALQARLGGMQIIDLCPKDGDPQSGILYIDSYAFIGFNNASFKNYNDVKRRESAYYQQEKCIEQVRERLNRAGYNYAYIFYHIPEIDDPYPVLDDPTDMFKHRYKGQPPDNDPYKYSSWFVHQLVRGAWNDVVKNEKVKGLFAGHFHDWRHGTYEGYHWLVGPEYLSSSLSKLHVCPPIAIGSQAGKETQARGFQEVSIDGLGKPAVHIFWLDSATATFDSEVNGKEAESLKQLQLGEIYEDNDRLKDAEIAYAKALDTGSPATRRKAFDSVQRVTKRQEAAWRIYLLTPLISAAANLTSASFTVLLSIPFVVLFYVIVDSVGKKRGQNRCAVVPLVDPTQNKLGANFGPIVTNLNEKMRYYFTSVGAIRGGAASLPLLGPSGSRPLIESIEIPQDSEFLKVVASAVKGPMGETIALILGKLKQPEYLVQGSLQFDGTNVNIVARLERSSRILRTWDSTFTVAQLVVKEKDLAFEILNFLRSI